MSTQPMPEVRGYRLLRVINHGGMSTVYLAEQIAPSREVAIKVMAPQALSDEVSRRRFENEVRTVARLEHPHVVRIHELGRTADGLPYYTMPYLSRGHLGQRRFLLDNGEPDEPRIIATLRTVLSALAYAHGRGVVHRDVKAENVLFDEGEQPLLADFGIALRRGFGPRVTAIGLAVGSTAYMAPEQARGEEVDGRADLYSMGVLAWEMLTGHLPFEAADALSMAVMHAQDPIPKLPAHLRHWQGFMNRALAKQPGERFEDVSQMSDMLTRVERRQGWPRLAVFWERITGQLADVPRWVLAATALVFVAIIGSAVLTRDNGIDGFFRAGAPMIENTVQTDPIASMLRPLPEAPLQAALDNARRQIAQRNLTAPEGDNAYASVVTAWQAEPDNPQVQAVADELTTALGAELLLNLRSGKDTRAKEYAGRVQQLADDTGTRVSPARSQLQSDIQQVLQHRVEQAATHFDSTRAVAAAALSGPLGLSDDAAAKLQRLALAIPRSGQRLPGDPSGAVVATAGVAVSRKPVSVDDYSRFATLTDRPAARCRERVSLLRVLAPRDWRNPGFDQDEENPVTCVSFVDAQAYAEWYSRQSGHTYRLPSTAEADQLAPEISGKPLSLWLLDCGSSCKQREVGGTSWRSQTPSRALDSGRGYDDVGFRLVREL
ncbi:bifunctional serine/threonine-protein kinase/formylglycine-generating enzyme family protein [Lysobacter sp. A286]